MEDSRRPIECCRQVTAMVVDDVDDVDDDDPVHDNNNSHCQRSSDGLNPHPHPPEEVRFWVTRARGKTLNAGGFGYYDSPTPHGPTAPTPTPAAPANPHCEAKDPKNGGRPPNTKTRRNNENENDALHSAAAAAAVEDATTTTTTRHGLFLEEVLFLTERGLLHVYDTEDETATTLDDNTETDNKNTDANHNPQQQQRVALTLAELFAHGPVVVDVVPLPHHQQQPLLSMPVYLVYQHLRGQTFRVVRHFPTRFSILNTMEEHVQRQLQRLPSHHCNIKKQKSNPNGPVPATTTETAGPTTTTTSVWNKDIETGDTSTTTSLHHENDNDDDEEEEDAVPRENDRRNTTGGQRRRLRHRNVWRSDATLQSLCRELRWNAARAPAPSVYPTTLLPVELPMQEEEKEDSCTATTGRCPSTTSSTKWHNNTYNKPTIAFHCYNPAPSFASACPGFPDFCIAIAFFNQSKPANHERLRNTSNGGDDDDNAKKECGDQTPLGLTFDDLRHLLKQCVSSSTSVPLKIATVSDSGTVVMFGVTDFGVPSIEPTSRPSSSC